jgi:hypothetical protein
LRRQPHLAAFGKDEWRDLGTRGEVEPGSGCHDESALTRVYGSHIEAGKVRLHAEVLGQICLRHNRPAPKAAIVAVLGIVWDHPPR